MNAARWALAPLSTLYGGLIGARNLYYDRFASAVRSAPVPVISVGNMTVGGTGKTPLVIDIALRLLALGRQPAILTRGYKAQAGETADEVREFHDALPGVPVVVNADRVAGATTACTHHAADCLVLDDGFQHRRLARDLDIVLIDALRPWGGNWVLPAGRLREPLGGLRRGDIFIITRANQATPAAVDEIADRLQRYVGPKPILTARVVATALVYSDGRRSEPSDLAERRVLPVCGIGNPATFLKLLATLGPEVTAEGVEFADHRRYSADDVATIAARADLAGAELVVTTRKDWVKLAPLWPASEPPLVRLDVRVALTGTDVDFGARLRAAVEMNR